jgi:hypothetical protein
MGTHSHASENYDGKEPPNTPDFSFFLFFFNQILIHELQGA